MWKFLFTILICLLQSRFASSQSTIGLPAIRNYRNTDYHAATNISDIGQDKRGVLYFANADGLLTFDGTYWKLYPLPNKAASKSLAIDLRQDRIYVGGQDEVGYFSPDHNGILNFHSLKEKLPEIARQFADNLEHYTHREQGLFSGRLKQFSSMPAIRCGPSMPRAAGRR